MQDEKKDAALALVKALEFELRDWNGKDLFHFPEINAVHVFNAAEFIKSLLAEVDEWKMQVAELSIQADMLRRSLQLAEADRQRMHDALERARPYVKNAASQYISVGIDADLRAVDAALTPASKEANDG